MQFNNPYQMPGYGLQQPVQQQPVQQPIQIQMQQHGFQPQGMQPQGMPVQGMPPQGAQALGIQTQGMQPQGMATVPGVQPHGMLLQGTQPQGMQQQGTLPHGIPQQGMSGQGMPQQGMPAQSLTVQGFPQQGLNSQGLQAAGANPNNSYGNSTGLLGTGDATFVGAPGPGGMGQAQMGPGPQAMGFQGVMLPFQPQQQVLQSQQQTVMGGVAHGMGSVQGMAMPMDPQQQQGQGKPGLGSQNAATGLEFQQQVMPLQQPVMGGMLQQQSVMSNQVPQVRGPYVQAGVEQQAGNMGRMQAQLQDLGQGGSMLPFKQPQPPRRQQEQSQLKQQLGLQQKPQPGQQQKQQPGQQQKQQPGQQQKQQPGQQQKQQPGQQQKQQPGQQQKQQQKQQPGQQQKQQPGQQQKQQPGQQQKQQQGQQQGQQQKQQQSKQPVTPQQNKSQQQQEKSEQKPPTAALTATGKQGIAQQLPSDATNSLYLENLPTDVTHRELTHIFRPFAGFVTLRLVVKEHTNREKSAKAFVDFTDAQAATAAMSALNGYQLDLEGQTPHVLRPVYARPPKEPATVNRGMGSNTILDPPPPAVNSSSGPRNDGVSSGTQKRSTSAPAGSQQTGPGNAGHVGVNSLRGKPASKGPKTYIDGGYGEGLLSAAGPSMGAKPSGPGAAPMHVHGRGRGMGPGHGGRGMVHEAMPRGYGGLTRMRVPGPDFGAGPEFGPGPGFGPGPVLMPGPPFGGREMGGMMDDMGMHGPRVPMHGRGFVGGRGRAPGALAFEDMPEGVTLAGPGHEADAFNRLAKALVRFKHEDCVGKAVGAELRKCVASQ
ncbi:hypothetical protein VOLCADRAFT_106208 [Volvox carteri f. nagariensis]|uniref:RRM domain-containing protein n=1 Tax=Volvox carteri f. nagariensis TaxID=3068 RepID=D8U5U1_VOLCA|nr:uncharacterized protein VOLCADRAFT_106208 [Volvox carteri f. nagariensis]EFJ44980.1 hypothetical protein VOLCADRAFT_106208 [Volvox carteri f. nagariensis]|eukprot:XP_002953951.1 hypothetical protein VOLCADRAFT_106208 [Volvox carteri f. nagariensis]